MEIIVSQWHSGYLVGYECKEFSTVSDRPGVLIQCYLLLLLTCEIHTEECVMFLAGQVRELDIHSPLTLLETFHITWFNYFSIIIIANEYFSLFPESPAAF